MAWLHAKPEGREQTRAESLQGTQFVNLPNLGFFAYLSHWFAELGLNYTYPDIQAWSQVTSTELTAWEAATLKNMTAAYQRQAVDSTKIGAQAPYFDDTRTEEERGADVSGKFKALAQRRGRKKHG